MTSFSEKLKVFLHDPVDKCFDISTHVKRAEGYALELGVKNVEKVKGPDMIASCMERSLLPKNIIQDFNEIKHPSMRR
jgi:CRISPR-associated protein Cmr2